VVARAPHLAEEAVLQDQLALQDDDHFLLLGRHADMINVAGKRASLADLSLKLLAIEGVHDGVFFLPEQETANQRPVALVVSDLPVKQILQQLALQMDAAFLPRPLRKVDRLPRNDTGKLTRAALHTLWSQTHD
jgi:acyl-coenzyme A synthetase/AMP-(fatty) acid ligase